MSRQTLVILNPESAAGRTGRARHEIEREIEAALGPVELVVTDAPSDATRIAREARLAGAHRILVAGGDGTICEVVSGLLEARTEATPAPALPVLGFLPLGSGSDFARTLGLPGDLRRMLELIARGDTRTIDAGRVEYVDDAGEPQTRAFANEASVGLSGTTIRLVGRLAKRVGPRIAFMLGAVAAIFSHRPFEVRVELDGEPAFEGPVSMVVAANGCYFGAGMKVAPEAVVDDGLLSVVIVRGLSVPRLLANLPSLFAGRHGAHPSVVFERAKSVSIVPRGEGAPIDIDGEALGQIPLRARVLPRALEVFAPKGS